MKIVPDQIGRWIPRRYVTLGTDGFGRSDTREALRRFFEVDNGHVVVGALAALAADGAVEPHIVEDAIKRYEIDTEVGDPRVR
jgi:pyruvate dehydrogenase E1 component